MEQHRGKQSCTGKNFKPIDGKRKVEMRRLQNYFLVLESTATRRDRSNIVLSAGKGKQNRHAGVI